MIGEYDSGYESCIDTMVRQMEGMQYRIDLMAHDNAALRAKNEKMRELLADLAICACGKYCYGCPHQYDGCDRDERLRELMGEEDA